MLMLTAMIGGVVWQRTASAELTAANPARTAGNPSSLGADRFAPPVPARSWKHIVLHHSATSQGSVESIDAVHRKQKDKAGQPWLGIGYHFVVGNGQQMGDGEIQPTFRWLKQLPGAHAGVRDYNETGIGICLIGNFDDTAPTDKQLAAVRELLQDLTHRYSIPRQRIVRHQDVQATLCPGRLFPWERVVADLPSVSKGS